MIKHFLPRVCSISKEDVKPKNIKDDKMTTTKIYKPLSAYIAGASDIEGTALLENGSPLFDDSASPGVAGSGPVDPFANPRVSVFDLVEQSGDPDVVESIRSSLGMSNPDTDTEVTE